MTTARDTTAPETATPETATAATPATPATPETVPAQAAGQPDAGPLSAEQVRAVVETAVRAPSVHNTQPWRFVSRTAAGQSVLDVRTDRSRLLALQDPTGRELHLSCGAAAMQARLGVRGLDRACTLAWLADPADPDLVARLTVGGPAPQTAQERALLAAVPLRHTDRSAFTDEPVDPSLVDALAAAAEVEGAHLDAERDHDRVLALEVLVARADQVLRQDPALQAELRSWVRDEAAPAEGVPADALPAHGLDRGSALSLRDFDPVDAAPGHDGDPPAVERPLLLVLSTDSDDPAGWLRAGAALGRVLLTATDLGLVANPQTQLLEVPGLRSRLVATLGLVGEPQLLLRVGRPTGAGSPQTGRRPVEAVLSTDA